MTTRARCKYLPERDPSGRSLYARPAPVQLLDKGLVVLSFELVGLPGETFAA